MTTISVFEALDISVGVVYVVVLALFLKTIQVANFGFVVAVVRSNGRTRYLPAGLNFVSPFAKVYKISLAKPLPDLSGRRGVMVAAGDPDVGIGIASIDGSLVPVRFSVKLPVGAHVRVDGGTVSSRMVYVQARGSQPTRPRPALPSE